ncbi:hypothetical protein GCM10022291_07700 [Postechiella marina]|uniref:HTH araC/xylS-type domain-containing protein n=1 Tax=Postechiella marina TaxID=943941 RepID=A0ABP8C3K0_9FLAO
MKHLHITATNFDTILKQLQTVLKGSIKQNLKEHILKFDTSLGYGTIRGTKSKGGISYLEFDVTFNEDIKLTIASPVKTAINFAYCSEGKMAHTFKNTSKRIELETFQTAILANVEQENNMLYFYRGMQVVMSLISVNTRFGNVGDFAINKELRQRYIEDRTEDVAIVSSYNLKIAERIKQLQAIKQEGVVRALLIEGLVHVILALEIEQHKKDTLKKENATGSLTCKEMVKVKDLSEFIYNFPETNLTVTELSHKIGLTPTKLQEGFKLMHNRTVNDFIRDVRVTKSEVLIKTTDMNISQILYTLGFSSRSYFSKIFKEKYNCSPSQYKLQNKLAVSA